MKFAADQVILLICLSVLAPGCSHVSDEAAETLSSDPSAYEFSDCSQLDNARRDLTKQAEETRALMAKAETGFAGSVVSATVYEPDLMKIRGSLKRLDDAWQRQHCTPANVPKTGPPTKQMRGVN